MEKSGAILVKEINVSIRQIGIPEDDTPSIIFAIENESCVYVSTDVQLKVGDPVDLKISTGEPGASPVAIRGYVVETESRGAFIRLDSDSGSLVKLLECSLQETEDLRSSGE